MDHFKRKSIRYGRARVKQMGGKNCLGAEKADWCGLTADPSLLTICDPTHTLLTVCTAPWGKMLSHVSGSPEDAREERIRINLVMGLGWGKMHTARKWDSAWLQGKAEKSLLSYLLWSHSNISYLGHPYEATRSSHFDMDTEKLAGSSRLYKAQSLVREKGMN